MKLYTISSQTKKNAIKAQSYEGAKNAAEMFNKYLDSIKALNEKTRYEIVEVEVEA